MNRLEYTWYNRTALTHILRPLSWLFCVVVWLRRWGYRFGLLRTRRLPVPVIVVGNVTVGGTGKTPLVIWLVEWLKEAGYSPGVISRGYGGRAKHWPQQVRADADPYVVGDEAVLVARRADCPMAVGPNRIAAGEALLAHAPCDIIVSDDGLQHYALGRDVEIAVVDGVRRFGNGLCLPAGPLREPVSRLERVDCVVTNGLAAHNEYRMLYRVQRLCHLAESEPPLALEELRGRTVHAVAGIGNPERFFAMLRDYGAQVIEHPFPDHHPYVGDDLVFGDDEPVVMTEKDAVKCRRFADHNHWYVPVEAELDSAFGARLQKLLEGTKYG